MLNFQNKGADFKRDLLDNVQDMVARMLSNISATIAAQKDGAIQSDGHRILNFQGAGVTVSDDPTMSRTNVLIGGTALVSTPTQLLISTTAAKALSLWNGSSNNAAPANWQTTGFNDSGWSAAATATGGAATTIAGATKIWSSTTPAALTEITLLRHSFTVPNGTYQSVSLTIEADNFIDAVYLNGTLLGSATNGVPGSSQSKATLSITPSLLIMGTNVLAVQARNADSILSAAWTAYVINSTAVTAAPTTSNTASGALTADVTIAVANTFYDGPTVSLGLGTWLLVGSVNVVDNTAGGNFTAKLWDGASNIIDSGEFSSSAGTASARMTLSGIVVLAATTTMRISVTNTIHPGASFIKAQTPQNAQGNTASHLIAVQIA